MKTILVLIDRIPYGVVVNTDETPQEYRADEVSILIQGVEHKLEPMDAIAWRQWTPVEEVLCNGRLVNPLKNGGINFAEDALYKSEEEVLRLELLERYSHHALPLSSLAGS